MNSSYQENVIENKPMGDNRSDLDMKENKATIYLLQKKNKKKNSKWERRKEVGKKSRTTKDIKPLRFR